MEFKKNFDAELHLLYVARVFGYFSTMYVDPSMITTMENSICEGAQKVLLEFKERYFGDTPGVVSQVESGYASEEIIHYAKDKNIDLIVMGTHGRSGLGKWCSDPLRTRYCGHQVSRSLLSTPTILKNRIGNDKQRTQFHKQTGSQ